MTKLFTLLRAVVALASASPLLGQAPASDIPNQIERILEENANYEFEDSMAWQAETLRLLREAYGDPAAIRAIEAIMADFLSSDATYAAKKKLWMDFANIATEQSLPALLGMLESDEKTAALAMLTLRKAGLEASEAVIARLPELSDTKKLGIIHHLGDLREPAAIDALRGFLESEDAVLGQAAFEALAEIGTPAAAEIVAAAFREMEAPIRPETYDAVLQGAERLAAQGKEEQAQGLYDLVLESKAPTPHRAAALNGAFKLSDDPIDFIRNRLVTSEEDLRPHLIRMVRDLPPSFSFGDELLGMDGLSPSDRVQLLLILAARRDPSIRQSVFDFLRDEDPALREAASLALPAVANASDADRLIDLAIQANEDERELLIAAISVIPDETVDQQLRQRLKNASSEELLVLMEIVQQRGVPDVEDLLFELAKHEDRGVRLQANRTLDAIGDFSYVTKALDSALSAESPSQRRAWERTAYRLALKGPDQETRSAEMVQRLNEASEPQDIQSLLLILGEIADPADLSAIRPFLEHSNRDIRIQAIRALSKWPNSDPLEELIRIYRNAADEDVRESALRGSLSLLDQDRSLSQLEKLDTLEALFDEAKSLSEKNLVIEAHGDVSDIATLRALLSYMKKSDYRAAAERAIQDIMRDVYNDDETRGRRLILKARRLSTNPDFKDWVDDGLRNEYFDR